MPPAVLVADCESGFRLAVQNTVVDTAAITLSSVLQYNSDGSIEGHFLALKNDGQYTHVAVSARNSDLIEPELGGTAPPLRIVAAQAPADEQPDSNDDQPDDQHRREVTSRKRPPPGAVDAVDEGSRKKRSGVVQPKAAPSYRFRPRAGPAVIYRGAKAGVTVKGKGRVRVKKEDDEVRAEYEEE